MTAPSVPEVHVSVRRSGATSSVLYPDELASFDMLIENRGTSAAKVLRLIGNWETPEIVVSDSNGRELARVTEYDTRKRSGSDPEHKEPPEPAFDTVDPGTEQARLLHLWKFIDPLGPGRYSLHIEHEIIPGGPVIMSNKAAFEIVAARIAGLSSGYAAIDRGSAVSAWLAAAGSAPEGNRRLLVRLSSLRSYSILLNGAANFGEFPADASVAVAQPTESSLIDGHGWVLATSGANATVFRHNLGSVTGRIGPVRLPAEAAVAVPGFPDYGSRALALATGRSNGGAVLTGFAVQDERTAAPWSVPLSATPVFAAAASKTQKLTYVAYAADDGRECRVFRIGVDPAGNPVVPEQRLRTSAHKARALRVIAGRGLAPSFLLLESDRQDPSVLTYVRIPMEGSIREFEPHRVSGWPSRTEGGPLRAANFDINQDPAGVIYVAATDADGNLYGGRLDRGLALLRKADGDPAVYPHIACLRRATTIGAFRSDGRLVFTGSAGVNAQRMAR